MAVKATDSDGNTVEVREGSTCDLSIKLYDKNGTQVYDTDISAITLTLQNENDRTVINSRSEWDISGYLQSSGSTYSVIVPLTAADNIIVGSHNYNMPQWHYAHITATIDDPASTLTEKVRFKVIQSD